jgi:hypothetical protein
MDMPRNIVLSRKGFDGGTGCIPSPILDEGTMLSMPIPDAFGTVSYGDLWMDGHSYGKLVLDLCAKQNTGKNKWTRLSDSDKAHLDPDLIHCLRERPEGWRPAFGQCDKAATILRRHGVSRGDLFLFFGWFRRCELKNGVYRFLRGEPDLHVIFGYLRVGDVIQLSCDPVPDWAKDHPHLHGTARKADKGNALFVAADCLGLPDVEDMPGSAAFNRFADGLRLTAAGMTRSMWRLPKWFYPKPGAVTLSSHEREGRWKLEEDSCILKSVARGQEFVLNVRQYPEAITWAASLIRQGLGTIR